jgi:hypothetical protein
LAFPGFRLDYARAARSADSVPPGRAGRRRSESGRRAQAMTTRPANLAVRRARLTRSGSKAGVPACRSALRYIKTKRRIALKQRDASAQGSTCRMDR